jgi:hypothetical protein
MLTLVGVAATSGLLLYVILGLVLSPALAGILAMGLGVGGAVYVDRRWIRFEDSAAAEALLYGAATAGGWAVARLVLSLLSGR